MEASAVSVPHHPSLVLKLRRSKYRGQPLPETESDEKVDFSLTFVEPVHQQIHRLLIGHNDCRKLLTQLTYQEKIINDNLRHQCNVVVNMLKRLSRRLDLVLSGGRENYSICWSGLSCF